jgi:hypothetical protein
VVDLSSSSDEENLIVDVSRDEEFARRLFNDLKRDILGLPGDDTIIILSDSDEEMEVCEEKAVDVALSSAARSPTPTASVDDADGTYKSNTHDRATNDRSSGRDEAGLP